VTQQDLEKHILATYFTLRLGLATMAILLPFILWIGGRLYADLPLQESMSAYYHASVDGRSMRDWFVGVLFASGACLYLYKGYSTLENAVLNFAGAFAVGIAICPMAWGEDQKFSIHGFCAVSFFLCIAFVCLFCAGDTLKLVMDDKVRRRFKYFYKLLGTVMIVAPVIAFSLSVLLRYRALKFYVEAAGIIAFSAYWLTKSRELSITESDQKAVRGQLAV